MSDLDSAKLKKVLDYLWSINGQLDGREKMMAEQLGMDIEKDLLIVPDIMLKGIHWLPKWVKASSFVKQPYVMKGVRDKLFFQRKEKSDE